MLKIDGERILEAKQYTWDKVRDKIGQQDQQLCEIIDKLVLDKTYLFTEVSYPFGIDIIENGELYIPLVNGGKIALNDKSLPESFTNNIIGSGNNVSIPVGIILEKNHEYYLPMGDRMVSHAITHPGKIFGFASVLNSDQDVDETTENDPIFPHNLRSGARTLIILAPITDNAGFNKLKKQLGLKSEKPASYVQHGDVCAEIIQKCGSTWRAPILFLPNKLVARLKQKDPEVAKLYAYLQKLHRSDYGIWHRRSKLWDIYLQRIEEEMHLQPSYSTVLNTVNHVLAIAANSAPGFIPSSGENDAPIKMIQGTYIKTYGILDIINQFPVIMVPTQISDGVLPVYYSFNHPTLSGYKSEGRGSKSIRANLDLFMRVIDIYRNWITKSDAKVKVPSLYKAIMNYKFECYHPDPSDYKNIKNSTLLFSEDPRFCGNLGTNPEHASFFKGCIKITKRKIGA